MECPTIETHQADSSTWLILMILKAVQADLRRFECKKHWGTVTDDRWDAVAGGEINKSKNTSTEEQEKVLQYMLLQYMVKWKEVCQWKERSAVRDRQEGQFMDKLNSWPEEVRKSEEIWWP